MVGAPRFELGTSCAQGRRATRLRYAPTVRDFDSTVLSEVCSAAKQTGTRSAEFLRHQQNFRLRLRSHSCVFCRSMSLSALAALVESALTFE